MSSFDLLERQLSDLATAVEFPRTPDLATAVGVALRSRPAHRPLFDFQRGLRRSLLLAVGLALLVVGAAFALRFGLELLSIEFGPIPTLAPTPSPPSPQPSLAPGTSLHLGRPVTLAEATDSADFPVLVPEALGPPDAVYDGGVALRGQVAFVYAPRDDLPPADLLDGAGLLITQNAGQVDEGLGHKIVDSSAATVQAVAVAGAPGLWISGAPHIFWYLTSDGEFIEESRRVVGDTLVWERDGILYRIEGAITFERALEIAASLR